MWGSPELEFTGDGADRSWGWPDMDVPEWGGKAVGRDYV